MAKRRLDFLVIGAQKAGTTALDKYLRAHPQVGMASEKEVHFFDDDGIYYNLLRRPNYTKYHRFFKFSSELKTYGEITPIYLYWESCWRRILKYNPKIKLITILRDPSERAFSHWNMQKDCGAETESFEYCIDHEEERSEKHLPLQNRGSSYIDRGYYYRQLKPYLSHFDKSQLLFIKYEDFKNNQEKELLKIFDFLDLSTEGYAFEPLVANRLKKHDQLSSTTRKRLISLYKNDIKKIEQELDWDCSDWLQ